MRFSSRLPPDLSPTPLAAVLGADAIDLTLSNPTLAGLAYEGARIRAALASEDVLGYDPRPLGSPAARGAVAHYLATLGRHVPPERVALTASTSEAYALVFKLLCDPGATLAVPAPSYPLVPHLAELEGVRCATYRLRPGERWELDLDSLAAALDAGARAVVLVSPNNPTGSVPTTRELARVRELCVEHDAALVIDEVFAPYGAAGGPLPPLAGDAGPLTFVLDGLSKSAALPQLKLGWVTVHGAPAAVDEALVRLEWLLDAYLSVSAAVQAGAVELLATAAPMQEQVRARLATNRAALATALAGDPGARLLAADGGWYAVVELARDTDEEELVTDLVQRFGVRVQPGFFFDFEREGYLVVSLLPPPATFASGAAALARGLRDR